MNGGRLWPIAAFTAVLMLLALCIWLLGIGRDNRGSEAPGGPLAVGFGEEDITPKLGDKPVYLAGFGQNRKATAIHDPLFARAVVFKDGKKKIAVVSVDLIGLFHANVLNIRKQLDDFDYVLVSSTHNHAGPDTLGLWGPNPFKSGVDPDYLKLVEERVVRSVRAAEITTRPAIARIGTAKAPELLTDKREPYVKHDELVALIFDRAPVASPTEKHITRPLPHETGGIAATPPNLPGPSKPIGVLIQWNCHPETLGGGNTMVSGDYVGFAVNSLGGKFGCPVAYLTGTVGGLMTSLDVPLQSSTGKVYNDGTFEKASVYGFMLGQSAVKALDAAKPITLIPFQVRSRTVYVPMENPLYRAARLFGIVQREAYVWTGDPYQAETEPVPVSLIDGKPLDDGKVLCIRTEVALIRLGELEIVAVPGEIYPELVLDKVQDPADPNADFPDAPIEPALYKQLKRPHRMIIGLANDEIGYILPKRQWDERPPFCYGRKKAQYGEQNSVGPEAGPIICRAIRDLAEGR